LELIKEVQNCVHLFESPCISSCTMAEVICCWSVTTEAWVQSKASLCWIFGGQIDNGSGFTSLILPHCSIFIRPSAKQLCDLCDQQQCLKMLFHVWLILVFYLCLLHGYENNIKLDLREILYLHNIRKDFFFSWFIICKMAGWLIIAYKVKRVLQLGW